MTAIQWALQSAREHLRSNVCQAPGDFEALACVLQHLHDVTQERDELRVTAERLEQLYTDASAKLQLVQPVSLLATVEPEVMLRQTIAFTIGTCAALHARGGSLLRSLVSTDRAAERAADKMLNYLLRVVAGLESVLGSGYPQLLDALEAIAKES